MNLIFLTITNYQTCFYWADITNCGFLLCFPNKIMNDWFVCTAQMHCKKYLLRKVWNLRNCNNLQAKHKSNFQVLTTVTIWKLTIQFSNTYFLKWQPCHFPVMALYFVVVDGPALALNSFWWLTHPVSQEVS